jgi:integrase
MAKLSDAKIRNRKADGTRQEIWDSSCSGLVLVVSPTGAKTFGARWRFNGQRFKRSLGDVDAITLDQAQEKVRQIRRDISEGKDPDAQQIKAAETVAEMAKRRVSVIWPEYVAERLTKESTKKKFKGLFEKHILPGWKDRRIETITKPDCIKAVRDAKERGKKNFAAASTVTVLSAFFNWCIGAGYIDFSPMTGIAKPIKAEDIARERTLTDVEVQIVWSAAGKIKHIFGPFVRMLLATGQRRSEVAQMKWEHVNLKTRVWESRVTKTRGRVPRIQLVYLNDHALAVLQSIPRIEGAEYVFSTDGKHPISGFSKFKTAIEKLAPGVVDWRLHDFRRTVSTNMQRLAINFHVKESCLAHTVKGVSKHYDRYEYQAEKKLAWTRWGGLLARIVAADAVAIEAYVAQFRPVDIADADDSNVVQLRA